MTDAGESDNSIYIGRSVGARAKNYEIEDKATGRIYNIVEGTRIDQVKVFAGYKGAKPLESETLDGLMMEYPESTEKWQHVKGFGTLDVDGEFIKAEIHWFQEYNVGRVKFKVKEWLFDES